MLVVYAVRKVKCGLSKSYARENAGDLNCTQGKMQVVYVVRKVLDLILSPSKRRSRLLHILVRGFYYLAVLDLSQKREQFTLSFLDLYRPTSGAR